MDFPTLVVPGENAAMLQLKGGNVAIR